MIKQLAHICIGSTDLAKSEAFYCNILGLEKTFEFIKNGSLYGFYAGAGNTTFIEVFMQAGEPNYEHPIIRHMCLEVDNLDEVIAATRSKGWEITDKKMGADNSWQAWITDPSGVRIELHEYTEESSQLNGNPCIVTW